ncbi:hypothetical protein C8R43DRAFT_955241 [Mycena crocata]|nr:hypothetical protein C8R43DRAFT_955241 [Mycena crocata]
MSNMAVASLAPPIYITLGFPLPMGVDHTRTNASLSPSYPARSTFVFKLRDTVLASELLSVQQTYLKGLKSFFPLKPKANLLEELAAEVYKAIPATVVARPLYPIATGAIAPFVFVHFHDWKRVECLRDALVYMILGGNDTSIVSLNLHPIVKTRPRKEMSPSAVHPTTKSEISSLSTPRKLASKSVVPGTPTPERRKPHCKKCGQPTKGHSLRPCTGIPSSPGQPAHDKDRKGNIMSLPSGATQPFEADQKSVDSTSETEEPEQGESSRPDDFEISHVVLGTFDSTKTLVQAAAKELAADDPQIQVLVVPKDSLVPVANFLTLEGLRFLIDGSREGPGICVYFGSVQIHVQRAYSAQISNPTGVDLAVKEMLTDCNPWEMLTYMY